MTHPLSVTVRDEVRALKKQLSPRMSLNNEVWPLLSTFISVEKPATAGRVEYYLRRTPPLPVMVETLKSGGDPFHHPGYYHQVKPVAYTPDSYSFGGTIHDIILLVLALTTHGILDGDGFPIPGAYQDLTPEAQAETEYLLHQYQEVATQLSICLTGGEQTHYLTWVQAGEKTKPWETRITETVGEVLRTETSLTAPPPPPGFSPEDTLLLTQHGILPNIPGEPSTMFRVFAQETVAWYCQNYAWDLADTARRSITYALGRLCSTWNWDTNTAEFNTEEAEMLLAVLEHVTRPYWDRLVTINHENIICGLDYTGILRRIHTARYREHTPYQVILDTPGWVADTIIHHGENTSRYTEYEQGFYRGNLRTYMWWAEEKALPIIKTGGGEKQLMESIRQFVR